jgi:hypothetical protein
MLDGSPVRNSIIKAVDQGKLLVRLPDGTVHDSKGIISGPEGQRKRTDGGRFTTLNLTSDVLVAPVDAECAAGWTKTDEVKPRDDDGTDFPDYTPDTVYANSWEEAISYAHTRPLKVMRLKAAKPDTAKTLVQLAQPFSAKSLLWSVTAIAPLRDGGEVRLMVEDVKYNSSLNPLDTATKLLRAASDDAEFEASLNLDFGDDGVNDVVSKLEKAQNSAAEGVGLEAEFGKEIV